MKLRLVLFLLCIFVAAMAPRVFARMANQYVSETMGMLHDAVAFRTVKGNGQMREFADYLADSLKSAGFDESDIKIIPVKDTFALTVRYSGSSEKKPILVLGHMDVVPADLPEQWVTEHPFKLTKKNGYLYGRGVADMKTEVVVVVQTFMRLKSEGFVPRRDIILLLTGGEESAAGSTKFLAQKYDDAAYAINAEGGMAILNSEGKPIIFGVEMAEKVYGDFKIEATSPGGHSSEPNPSANAIYRLSQALVRITEYQFPIKYSEVSRAWLKTLGKHNSGLIGAAMTQFAAHPGDNAAAAVLSSHPAFIGQIGTTCIPTMVQSGQAPNALPQLATAIINCRIWPGVTAEELKSTLTHVIGDKSVQVTYAWKPQSAPASPVNHELMEAITDVAHKRYPDVSVTPMMGAFATDCAYFRQVGTPCYGVDPIYAKAGEKSMHAVNERIRVGEVSAALNFWRSLLQKLTK